MPRRGLVEEPKPTARAVVPMKAMLKDYEESQNIATPSNTLDSDSLGSVS